MYNFCNFYTVNINVYVIHTNVHVLQVLNMYSSRQKKVHVFAPPYDRATKLSVPFPYRTVFVPFGIRPVA